MNGEARILRYRSSLSVRFGKYITRLSKQRGNWDRNTNVDPFNTGVLLAYRHNFLLAASIPTLVGTIAQVSQNVLS